MVLSVIATGGRGRKVVALVDVRRAHFYAPSRRRAFVEVTTRGLLRWESVGCCSPACAAQGNAPQNWEKKLASTFSAFQDDESNR